MPPPSTESLSSAMELEPTDIFPEKSAVLEPFVLSAFKTFPQETIYPFISCYDANVHRMYYMRLDVTPQLLKHCEYVIRAALKHPELHSIQWYKIYDNFQKASQTPRNTDMRTGFKIEPNTFIVKKEFTFGLRRVEEGTQHVLQLGKAPLHLYLSRGGFPFDEKRIYPDMRNFYCRQLLPKKKYTLPEKTQYVLVSPAKTIFTMHILDQDYLLDDSYLNPWAEEPVRTDYSIPPRTPRIEDHGRLPTQPVYYYVIAPSESDLMPPPPAQPENETVPAADPQACVPEPPHSPELQVLHDAFPTPLRETVRAPVTVVSQLHSLQYREYDNPSAVEINTDLWWKRMHPRPEPPQPCPEKALNLSCTAPVTQPPPSREETPMDLTSPGDCLSQIIEETLLTETSPMDLTQKSPPHEALASPQPPIPDTPQGSPRHPQSPQARWAQQTLHFDIASSPGMNYDYLKG